MASLAPRFRSVVPPPACPARELDEVVSRLTTSRLEALLRLERDASFAWRRDPTPRFWIRPA
jgi:hypothetical protein